MKNKLKRAISFLLVLVMVVMVLPVVSIANAAVEDYVGFVDFLTNPEPGKVYIKGWTADRVHESESIKIHVYIGAPAGADGGYEMHPFAADKERKDVNNDAGIPGNHGFEETFDSGLYGTQQIYVYAVCDEAGQEDHGNALIHQAELFISPPDPAYGDQNWILSQYDKCPNVSDGVYRIASAANTNYSLDVIGGSLDNNVDLQLFGNAATDAQLFHLRRISYVDSSTGNGMMETETVMSLMNIKSQRFVASNIFTGNVFQSDILPNNSTMQWIMHDNGDGSYSFESVFEEGSFITIDVASTEGRIENGTKIIFAPWQNSVYQKFYLSAEYVNGDGRLSDLDGYMQYGQYRFRTFKADGAKDAYVLEVVGLSTAEGANAQIWTAGDNTLLQQIFDVQKDHEGWYTIRNINSGLYLVAASGAAGKNGDAVQQRNTAGDEAKWAFVPRVRSDNNSLCYWIVNKATGLYLFHWDNNNGEAASLSYLENSNVVDTDWRSWGMERCPADPATGTMINTATGVAADQFDTTDTINLPIKIYDYANDGMLFEYSLGTDPRNAGFSFAEANVEGAYSSWTISRNTLGEGNFEDAETSKHFIGEDRFWNQSPDGRLNHIYTVNTIFLSDIGIDLNYLSSELGYSFYGHMSTGLATVGLVKPTLQEVKGYRLMEYNDETVAYVADLLDQVLAKRYAFGIPWVENHGISGDIPMGVKLEGYNNDMAGLLLENLIQNNKGDYLRYNTLTYDQRRVDIYNSLVETYTKKDLLIGTWEDCKAHISTYTDAAYFLLNNLFYPRSYNVPQDKFDYLVLSKATLSNGKTAYIFDSNFSDTYDYEENVTQCAVKYDFDAKTISNTSMMGKPGRWQDTFPSPYYTFLPVWESENVQQTHVSPYSADPNAYANKNYNYVLQCNGVFTYIENDGLFFDFAGDDDVYLFINGQLVLDIGGAHTISTVEMNLNDYVYAARAAVAAGSDDPRDLALALEDGEDYSFDFYYMERHTSDANMRIATNIRVSDPNLKTEKKAYQNGQELNNGGLVNVEENVEYSFVLTNPEDSLANLYHLSFADAKLGVTIDAVNGLAVTGDKTLNSQGTTLTAADLKVYFTNQKGTTQEVVLDGTDEDLKTYLAEINGNGLLPGCSVEIRGIYYNIENSDFVSGRFSNTLQVTANQEANGEGDTYQASDNMVVCIASGPQYYQWSGNVLNVTAADFTGDVNTLLQEENSALLEQIAPATSLGTVTKLEICDMKGNVIPSSNATADATGISLNYSKPGTYVLYVKVTQSDNSTVIIPVQVNVVNVEDSVFVLDYGLKVDLTEELIAKDSLSVAGKNTKYVFEALTKTAPGYENNHITFSDGQQAIDGTYGKYLLEDKTLEYHPKGFMESADTVYLAVRVYEDEAGETVGAVDINSEVEMFKKITVLPANVVYYEDDFPAIKYYGNGYGNSANTFTIDGTGSGAIYQSADQSGNYGYDDAYASGTTQSGSSGHEIKIKDTNVAAEFTFVGTGFELISRCMDADNSVLYLDVFNAQDSLIKRIPVILEYDNLVITNGKEGIYQVPVVKVDDLDHGTYKVQIHGVPVYAKDENGKYIKDENGNYVIDKENAPTLYIDGLRVYNALAMTDPDRDYYIDGEATAEFLEIRDLILEGKAAAVSYDGTTYSVTTGTSTFTENRNGELYPVNTFTISSVSHTGYLVDADAEKNLCLSAEGEQFEFSFAKTVSNKDYFYIHFNSGNAELYMMKNEDSSVSLKPLDSANDSFLWEISYLDTDAGIVTICNIDGGYLGVSAVDTAAKTGQILLSAAASTEDQKWELGAVASTEVFTGNVVTSVNDYLVFGPNNELYLDGVDSHQALVFYFTPDDQPETTTMIQVGVHVLNDGRLFGGDGTLNNPGSLYQSANTETPGWKVLDDNIQTSTERYYPIDLSLCKFDEEMNRYEVVLYCEDGYLSFTNLKVSGGSIRVVNHEVTDLRYNNGILELLTSVGATQTKTWMPVSNPEDYVDFDSISRQMNSTVLYEADVDTGEFVPAIPDHDDWVVLVGRSLLFKDIVKMRFYFNISATGVTTATPENSGLLVWTAEEYAALDSYTVENAGQQIRGLTHSVNGYYADTTGIPAKNMIDDVYVRAYVILPDGSYAYSEVTNFSPVAYAQLILEKEDATETMKELAIALMNYGAAAQVYFNYKTDTLMNAWLTEAQREYTWSQDMINALPKDASKFSFAADERIEWLGSSVTFTGAVNQNFYFTIPEELTRDALKIELLYWTESDYNELSELTVDNARKADFSIENGRAVIAGTAAKDLGKAFYLTVHIVYEEGEAFSDIYVDSAHDYARRVLSSSATSDAMKDLAKALVYYSIKAKNQLGG